MIQKSWFERSALIELIVSFYLALSIHIGLSTVSPWVLPAVFIFILIQRLILPGATFRRLLFAEFGFSILILYKTIWPITSLSSILIFSTALSVLLFILPLKKEITPQVVKKIALVSLPAFIYLIDKDYYRLVNFGNEWRLLAEQGPIMSWITRVLHGQIPFQDSVIARGPFLLYSSAAFMKTFGETLVMKRAWLLFLNLGMAYCYYYFCRKFIKSNLILWLTMILIILIHNYSYRHGFALLGLAYAFASIQNGSRLFAVASGVSISLSLLSSIEVGLCAAVSILIITVVGFIFDQERRKDYVTLGAWFMLAIFASFLPLIVILSYHGALRDVIQGMIFYPMSFAKGFMSLPFPNLFKMIGFDYAAGRFWFPISTKVLVVWYLPVIISVATFFVFLRWIVQKRITLTEIGIVLVAGFGWLLFHSALGRSDYHHLYFAVPPLFALLWIHGDRIVADDRTNQEIKFSTILNIFMAAAFSFLFLFFRSSDLIKPFYSAVAKNISGEAPVKANLEPFEIERIRGTLATPSLRRRIENVVKKIQSRAEPGDKIFVFPNMPLYYFILDSPPPTQFDLAYHAITTDMRLQAVEDLKRQRPRFVIYSTDPKQNLDRIPIEESAPEIVEYLKENYRVWAEYDTDQILIPKLTAEEREMIRKKSKRGTE
jgi:hypothetical protein